ncbi:MAG: 4'-phosphopantetheinyl transferase superfamily protein, partial [Elusimicrobiota bacterium]|nr:4'-phosphopantetheinyl transferase superfamily protein [Elusimicrobiota bacterium]
RFAGKEAVIKAFNDRAIKLRDIEIINDKKGNPFVKIYDKKYSLISNKISISLSHSRDFAVAFVIIE